MSGGRGSPFIIMVCQMCSCVCKRSPKILDRNIGLLFVVFENSLSLE